MTADETTQEEAETAAPESATLHGHVVVSGGDMDVVHGSIDGWVELITALAADGYAQCLDLFAVDYLEHMGRALPAGIAAERFEVVVLLMNHAEHKRMRIRVQVPESDPTVPTLFFVHPGTEAPEREAADMFGIVFEGHPDPSRILMPEDWVGHPLRKDYAIGQIPVQFKGAPAAR